ATLYVNAFPCKICAKLIINARIRRVVISSVIALRASPKKIGSALANP
ncbi:MAG: hypothetical protein EFT35_08425, partial [Methanophagales archaeon ANME-1-THS]